ncbi:MAG TPA: hydrophobe/amphiphile efflux-1 family RND transporter [Succinivibrionaceae bacterium]|nr:hydrophobe/amphiphile efflux-1 family RND transporter [Succinivibrionaceae bacterium]
MASYFINRPIFAWVIAIVIMLSGLLAVNILPVSQYPVIAPPAVRIRASYPGADASTVERAVTQIMEQNLIGLDGMMYMVARSDSYGNSSITINFEPGTNPDIAQVQVQNKLQQAKSQLPNTVQQRGVSVTKSTDTFLMVAALVVKDDYHSSDDLSDYIYSNLQEPLARVPGVGALQIFGSQYSMRIWIDPQKLNNLSVTTAEVINAVKAQNAQVTYGALGGTPAVAGQPYTFTITGQKRLEKVEEFQNILIKVNKNGTQVRLKDIARIELGQESYNYGGFYNGKPASSIAISLSSGSNALSTARHVKKLLSDMQPYFPEWSELVYPYDTTEFIEVSIHEVFKTLVEAVGLVILIMFMFMRSIRATLIPSITVPVVLLGTFASMSVFGFSVNTLTMFGLVLSIGLLVDDAIVVVENVERIMHEEPELTAKEATQKSMGQITYALVGIATVLSAVFIPMAFFGGSTGIIYRQFSITIVSAMILSVSIAIILTPALCATILKRHSSSENTRRLKSANPFIRTYALLNLKVDAIINRWNDFFSYLRDRYQQYVQIVVKKIASALVVYVSLCAILCFGFLKIPSSFLPSEDQGVMMTSVSLPAGSTIEQTKSLTEKVYAYFFNAEKENVKSIQSVVGFSFAGQGQNSGMAFIKMKDWSLRTRPDQHVDQIVYRSIKPLLGFREGLVYAFNVPTIPGLGAASGFDLFICDNGHQGHDMLQKVAKEYIYKAQQSPKLAQVRIHGMEDTPQLKLLIDYEKAMSLGLNVASINSTLSSAWGSNYVDNFLDRDRVKKVYLQSLPEYRMTPDNLQEWQFKNNRGQMVPFSSFGSYEWIYGSPRLERYNGVSAINIKGAAARGYSSGEAMLEMQNLAKEVLPPGFGIFWTGVSYQERLSGSQAPFLYAISLLVVFLSLAALYESWSIPFAVMLVIPLGIIGAILAADISIMLPFGQKLTNDVYFQVGLLTTVGLSAKNAILIVEFAKHLYDNGEKLTAAVSKAGRIRFRPIVMTSMAFILGVLPLALSTGAGASGRNEIGRCVIGGMLSSSILEIFFVPIFFVLIMRYFTRKPEVKQS